MVGEIEGKPHWNVTVGGVSQCPSCRDRAVELLWPNSGEESGETLCNGLLMTQSGVLLRDLSWAASERVWGREGTCSTAHDGLWSLQPVCGNWAHQQSQGVCAQN